jgi:hypothetical protein
LPPGSGGVNRVLLPAGADGTKSTNVVTPAAPTPLSTAELASADLTPVLRFRDSAAALRERVKVRGESRGVRPARPGTVPTGAIGGT